jgi:hypothetical protein
VLCSFWFWRDPAPSAAELLLPTFLAHAPSGRRPFIGILSDDAHSAKAAMMADWEPTEDRRAFWREKVRSLPPRQAAVYSLADAVIHISEADSSLERAAFNGTARAWAVVRMSLRSFTRDAAAGDRAAGGRAEGGAKTAASAETAVGGAQPAVASRRAGAGGRVRGGAQAAGDALYVGFVGNGITPTNHLAVAWFLDKVWPDLHLRFPALRLRLVGMPPDDRPKRKHGQVCKSDAPIRCGWAWGTQYASRETENGIDALGFVPDADMVTELLSWRAMVVPILRSTGVNTKLLPALQWGVPIVLTSVAANPLAIPSDGSVALIANDEAEFVTQVRHEKHKISTSRKTKYGGVAIPAYGSVALISNDEKGLVSRIEGRASLKDPVHANSWPGTRAPQARNRTLSHKQPGRRVRMLGIC